MLPVLCTMRACTTTRATLTGRLAHSPKGAVLRRMHNSRCYEPVGPLRKAYHARAREVESPDSSPSVSDTSSQPPLEGSGLDYGPVAALLLAGVFTFLQHADPALASLPSAQHPDLHIHMNTIYDVAEGEDFWENVGRYISYFFSVMLGTVYVMVKPFGELLKRPGTAIALVCGLVLLYVFLSNTIQAMLGLSEFS